MDCSEPAEDHARCTVVRSHAAAAATAPEHEVGAAYGDIELGVNPVVTMTALAPRSGSCAGGVG